MEDAMEKGVFRKNEEEEPDEYQQSFHDQMLERRMGLELGFCDGFSVWVYFFPLKPTYILK